MIIIHVANHDNLIGIQWSSWNLGLLGQCHWLSRQDLNGIRRTLIVSKQMTLFPSIQNVNDVLVVRLDNVVINDDLVLINNLSWSADELIDLRWQGLQWVQIFDFLSGVQPWQCLSNGTITIGVPLLQGNDIGWSLSWSICLWRRPVPSNWNVVGIISRNSSHLREQSSFRRSNLAFALRIVRSLLEIFASSIGNGTPDGTSQQGRHGIKNWTKIDSNPAIDGIVAATVVSISAKTESISNATNNCINDSSTSIGIRVRAIIVIVVVV